MGEGVFTETFHLSVADPIEARDEIVRYARLLDLQVEHLAESRGRFEKLLVVTVRGTHDELEDFRHQFARGSSDWWAADSLVLGLVLSEAGDAFNRWRRKRRRERLAREQTQQS